MNLLNRILSVIFVLAVLALTGMFAALVWLEDRNVRLGEADRFRFLLDIDASGGARVVATAVAAAVALLLVPILVLELRPRREKQLRLRPGGGDSVYVPQETLVQRVEEDASRIPHVERATARVEAKGKGVAVDLTLSLDPDAEIAPTVEAVTQSVEDGLVTKFGVPLAGRPTIHVRYDEIRIRRPDRGGATVPEPAAATERQPRAQDMPTQTVPSREGPREDADPAVHETEP